MFSEYKNHNSPVDSLFVFCFVLLLFYPIATVFQLYLAGDMMYEMKVGRKPEPTLSLTQGIFNLPHSLQLEPRN